MMYCLRYENFATIAIIAKENYVVRKHISPLIYDLRYEFIGGAACDFSACDMMMSRCPTCF